MTEKRIIWVAYTHTGRGIDVPIALCVAEATAIRLAQGPVRTMELVKIDDRWYAPSEAINLIEPTSEDLVSQLAIDSKRAVLEKAKAAGLTEEDLQVLMG